MSTDHDLADLFDIDLLNLHEEWRRQPGLYHHYAAALAEARADLDRAESNLDLVSAQIDAEVRADPAAHSVAKVTESVVSNAVLMHEDYRKAKKKQLEAKRRVGELAAVVAALDHRKAALENAVRLSLASYFSSPRVSGEEGREYDEEVKKEAARRKGVRQP